MQVTFLSSVDKACRWQWLVDSMSEALKAVKIHRKNLRQAAREYNVLATTLKNDMVDLDAKPRPQTVLTKEEEEKLCRYV